MRRLLDHVASMSDDDILYLPIQDAAICQVWLSNGGAETSAVEGFAKLEDRLSCWLVTSDPASSTSEGRRCQTLLRELIDRLYNSEVESMQRDELDLIEAVFGLSQASQHAGAFERIRRAITPYRTRIATRRNKLPDVEGTPTLSGRLRVVTPEDIAAMPNREVRMLAGVELPSRGPVLTHKGHLRVLGDVAENATLVVEEAACVVDGYVMGHIAVSGDCEVLENISGAVISRNGDIRARNVIDGAFVVAKRGWVHCRRCQGARTLFAGTRLRVVEQVRTSDLYAPEIEIEEAAESGELHTSRWVTASDFQSVGNTPLTIVFHRMLSCKDYGEDPGRSMATDVSRALRLRGRLSHVERQLEMVVQNAEQAAESALLYIIEGENAGRLAQELLSAQRRLNVLRRVVSGVKTLYADAEADMEASGTETESAPDMDSGQLVDEIEGEIDELLAELPGDTASQERQSDLRSLRSAFGSSRGNKGRLRNFMANLGERLARWRAECVELGNSIEERESALRRSSQVQAILDGGNTTRSRVLALRTIVERAKANPEGNTLGRRVGSAFVTKTQKTVAQQLSQAQKLKEQRIALEIEFKNACEHVLNQYQLHIQPAAESDTPIYAEGRFEAGVRLFADPAYLSDDTEGLSPEGATVSQSSGDDLVRYLCDNRAITGEAVAEEADTAAVV